MRRAVKFFCLTALLRFPLEPHRYGKTAFEIIGVRLWDDCNISTKKMPRKMRGPRESPMEHGEMGFAGIKEQQRCIRKSSAFAEL